MDSAQLIASLLGAGGGGAVLTALITGLVKWKSGEAGRERAKNTSLDAQRMKAIEERDKASERADIANVKRRMTEEYASSLRRQLIENGHHPGDWPDMDKTITKAQLRKVRAQSKE